MAQKSRYFKIGLTVFLTTAAILLFYDTLFGSGVLLRFGKQFLTAARPVLYGAFMAYLLAPLVNFFEVRPFASKSQQKSHQKSVYGPKITRAVSIFLAWAFIAVILYLLGSVLLPELYKSLVQLVSNIENYYYTVAGWIQHLFENNPALEAWVAESLGDFYTDTSKWLTTEVLPQAGVVVTALSGGIMSIVTLFGDLLIGVIVSIYFLNTKEVIAAHTRKVVYSLFSEDHVYWILRGTRKADAIFSGFVRGKLVDSLIIGIICFLGCTLLKFPYTPLISVVVGVTNIIPFFGPFLGAIPSAFLILLVSPIQCLYFSLFILALQQLDGNVIGPKILGDKTGLSNIWVILAILVSGSFFGFVGMFFGVPVFACGYSLVHFLVEVRLERKGMPSDTESYEVDPPRGTEWEEIEEVIEPAGEEPSEEA